MNSRKKKAFLRGAKIFTIITTKFICWTPNIQCFEMIEVPHWALIPLNKTIEVGPTLQKQNKTKGNLDTQKECKN